MRRHVAVALVALVLLVAQTETTTPQIDLSIIYSILPILISLMVIVLIFSLISGLFKSIGDMFRTTIRAYKPRARSVAALTPALLIAQTEAPQIDLSIVYGILPVLVTIMVVFLVIGLLMGLFRSIGDMASDTLRK